MTIWAFLAAALKALPLVLQLVTQFKAAAEAKEQRGLGRDEAVAESLREASAMIMAARQAEQEAAQDHATKTDDSAFDPEFKRED